MKYQVVIEGVEHEVVVQHVPGGGVVVTVDGAPWEGDVHPVPGGVSLRKGDQVLDVLVGGTGDRMDLAAGPLRTSARVESLRGGRKKRGAAASDASELRAPMPGRIVEVLVENGAQVEPGTPLVVIEAMKMENELRAERAGEIASVEVKPGQDVEANALLLRFA